MPVFMEKLPRSNLITLSDVSSSHGFVSLRKPDCLNRVLRHHDENIFRGGTIWPPPNRRIAYRTGIRRCGRFDFCGYRYGKRKQTVGMRDTFEVRVAVAPHCSLDTTISSLLVRSSPNARFKVSR